MLLTGANTHSILLFMLAVRPTWVGITWIKFFYDWNPGRYERALGDGIPCVTIETSAFRQVADGVANGIDPTHSRTRVHTLVVNTGSVGGTVCVHDTLWSAGKVRVSKVARYTGACSSPLLGTTLSVGPAWGRVTGIDSLSGSYSGLNDHPSALAEGVSSEAAGTLAHWLVVDHLTNSIGTT
jgi:hypothetical protein